MMKVEVILDYVRPEEKLIIQSFKNKGIQVFLTNLRLKPLSWIDVDGDIDLSLIRSISMYRAVYSACMRESINIQTMNDSYSILVSGDKILTFSKLKMAKIPFPETYIAFSGEAVLKAGQNIGFPLIDKPPIGSWGRLVTLVKDFQVLKTIIEHREMMFSQNMKTHVLQRYVKDDREDVRVLTLPNQIIGAVVKRPKDGEWRSNVALGAQMELYKLDSELEEITFKVAEAVGGEFLAVDIFREGGRYLVNEVNGVPEFKGFMTATRIDVPDILTDYVKMKNKN